MVDSYLRTTCRMCNSGTLTKAMSLTPTPPGNRFLTQDELAHPEPTFPLELFFCEDCKHVQLGHVVDPRILYQRAYSYVSATSADFVEHLRKYAANMVERFSLKPEGLVADIGSNDGTCLRFFADAGMKVLGVDPATEIARKATSAGIPTIGEFFDEPLGARLRQEYGAASFITSHNACAHIDDLQGVLKGARNWLADDGVFVAEVGYLMDVVENAWFDTIYHEHLDYHTVAPFRQLFARVGMELISVERVSPQGGSIRVLAQKVGGPKRPDGSVPALIELEHEKGIDRSDTLVRFGQRIDRVGRELRSLVTTLKSNGKTIAGYGAATKATTLLSHFRLGKHELDFIVDDNPLKQGLFSPASHIPVIDPSEIYARQPDYLLLLAWNFAEPIMATHREYSRRGGRFLLPMPVPRVV